MTINVTQSFNMKKIIVSLALLFAVSTTLTSCRDTKESTTIEVEVDDDVIATDDDATDPIENTVQEGANEVLENTGLGGTDDN